MRILDRQLIKRFAVSTLLFVLLFYSVVLAYLVPRFLEDLGRGFSHEDLLEGLRHLLVSFEVALTLACPLGVLTALLRLKKAGLLTVLLSTPLALSRLRAMVAWAAALTLILSSLCVLLDVFTSSGGDRNIWSGEGTTLWSLKTERGGRCMEGIHIFRHDNLEVIKANEGKRVGQMIHLSEPRRIFPFPDHNEERIPREWRLSSPVSMSPTGSFSFRGLVTLFNRMSMGAVLVMLIAYIGLLVPISKPWMAYLAVLLIVPASGIGTLCCTIGLWMGSESAVFVVAGWWLLIALSVWRLDLCFRRRGLRMV